MNIVYAQQNLPNTSPSGIFLAGPTPRNESTQSWRPKVVKILKTEGFTGDLFIPEDEGGGFGGTYEAQVEWEWAALELAKVILFWIPRDLLTMPAFTTNVEFGMYHKSGKIVLGYPQGSPKNRYLHSLAIKNNIPVTDTLEDTINSALRKV